MFRVFTELQYKFEFYTKIKNKLQNCYNIKKAIVVPCKTPEQVKNRNHIYKVLIQVFSEYFRYLQLLSIK